MPKRIATYSAWAIVAIFMAGIGSGTALTLRSHTYRASMLELAIAFAIYPIVGAIIIAHRPRNVIGRILVAIGFGTTTTYFSASYLSYSLATAGHLLPGAAFIDWVGNWVWPINLGLGILLLLLFPTGHLLSRGWRWVFWLACIGIVANVIASAFMPGGFSGETTSNPYGVESLRGVFNVTLQLSSPLIVLVGVCAVASALWRFWRSRGVERQQMKWFAFGVALLFIAITVTVIWVPQNSPYSNVGFAIGFGVAPLSIGIAVLRYQLYDIDIIINRALVYGSLTVALAAVYFSVVIGSESLTALATGAHKLSPVITVLSTLLIAALFQPLRRRIQRAIDRRFYRHKYDAARMLAAFGNRLRTEVELEGLCDQLVLTVEDSMQPEYVSLWLRPQTAHARP